MNPTISLSNAALIYIKKWIEKNKGIGFRLSIKKTGCSGYSYAPSVVEATPLHDMVTEIEGLKIYLDVAWLHLLQGLQIDYQEDNKTGLKQKKLIFNNPKETSRCGCGESFHVATGLE